MTIHRNWGILNAALAATLIAGSISFAQRSVQQDLALPPTRALRQKLQRKVTVAWQGQELAAALDRLMRVGQVTLWLDRRVDRQQIVNAQFVDLPLQQVLEALAETKSLGVAQLSQLVYVGPQQAARELTTLALHARSMLSDVPPATRRRWLQAQPVSWPRLSEPRALATDWLKQAGIELIAGQRIAHDLCPAQSLPSVPLVDRLVLLLAGFDLTCQIAPDGKRCEVVPIRRPLEIAPQLPLPPAEPRRTGRGSSRQLFTLQLENQPLGRVLDQLAQQLQLEIVWPDDAAERTRGSRKLLVSCDLHNVELDELLGCVLASANLQYQRTDKKVIIQAKPKENALRPEGEERQNDVGAVGH